MTTTSHGTAHHPFRDSLTVEKQPSTSFTTINRRSTLQTSGGVVQRVLLRIHHFAWLGVKRYQNREGIPRDFRTYFPAAAAEIFTESQSILLNFLIIIIQ